MRIGRYDVIEKLGAGGMGIVYKALDREHDRPAAIKMIGNHATIETTLFVKNARRLPEGRDANRRMMLIREARLANELDHPNIVRVYDYGAHAGLLYIVMEYLEGNSLDRLLSGTPPLPLARRIAIVAQMCDGLDFAHRQGVIHRDVKPGNTFVCRDGVVKVLDFGIAAKLAEGDGKPNPIVGTPNYMAPEVISGKAGVDARVDVWAAGITLYESVTGRNPFAAPSPGQTLTRIVHDPYPPLPRNMPGVEAMERILALALNKNPAERYTSAGELAGELHRLAAELAGTQPTPRVSRAQAGVPQQPANRAPGFAFDIGLSQTKTAVLTSSRRIAARRLMQRLEAVNYSQLVVLWILGTLVWVNRWMSRELESVASEGTLDRLLGAIISLMFLGYLFLKTAPVPLSFVEYLEALPRCRNCKSWMREKTKWTRFAHTNDAVNLGLSDCVAALSQNLWEDAAKLLFLHGDETSPTVTNTVVSAPIRYHLCFFECRPCDHQCARVTIEDKVEADWVRREEQFEAYKAGKLSAATRSVRTRVSTVVHSLNAAARTTIHELSQYSWIIIVFVAIVLFFILGWLILEVAFRYPFLRLWRT